MLVGLDVGGAHLRAVQLEHQQPALLRCHVRARACSLLLLHGLPRGRLPVARCAVSQEDILVELQGGQEQQ